MKDINFPPFYPEQRVVCVNNSRTDEFMWSLKKGKEYIINSCHQCPVCKRWAVDIGLSCPTHHVNCHCKYQIPASVWWADVNRFAPIEEKFESISLTKVYEIESPLISVN